MPPNQIPGLETLRQWPCDPPRTGEKLLTQTGRAPSEQMAATPKNYKVSSSPSGHELCQVLGIGQ